MRKDDLIRLRHMLDAAREAVEFAQDGRREDLVGDRKLTLALVKDVGAPYGFVCQSVVYRHHRVIWSCVWL